MSKKASLYRMKTDEHICPYGIKSKDLLEREGYEVEDHLLRTREETEHFKDKHNVETTPQTFIGGERIGGYEDLRRYFGKSVPDDDEKSYQPVIAIFVTSFLMALAVTWSLQQNLLSIKVIELFVAFSMVALAIQKLKDLRSFSTMFVTYDLLAMKWVRYAYIYPFVEAYAGIGMLAGLPAIWYAPGALFIGTVGAVSVFKAVYVDKRELKCACVGGSSNVPLGFVSLSENLFMIAAGVWMLVKPQIM